MFLENEPPFSKSCIRPWFCWVRSGCVVEHTVRDTTLLLSIAFLFSWTIQPSPCKSADTESHNKRFFAVSSRMPNLLLLSVTSLSVSSIVTRNFKFTWLLLVGGKIELVETLLSDNRKSGGARLLRELAAIGVSNMYFLMEYAIEVESTRKHRIHMLATSAQQG